MQRIASTNVQLDYNFIGQVNGALAHMCRPAAYTVIDEVSKLPLNVSDIYRRITT